MRHAPTLIRIGVLSALLLGPTAADQARALQYFAARDKTRLTEVTPEDLQMRGRERGGAVVELKGVVLESMQRNGGSTLMLRANAGEYTIEVGGEFPDWLLETGRNVRVLCRVVPIANSQQAELHGIALVEEHEAMQLEVERQRKARERAALEARRSQERRLDQLEADRSPDDTPTIYAAPHLNQYFAARRDAVRATASSIKARLEAPSGGLREQLDIRGTVVANGVSLRLGAFVQLTETAQGGTFSISILNPTWIEDWPFLREGECVRLVCRIGELLDGTRSLYAVAAIQEKVAAIEDRLDELRSLRAECRMVIAVLVQAITQHHALHILQLSPKTLGKDALLLAQLLHDNETRTKVPANLILATLAEEGKLASIQVLNGRLLLGNEHSRSLIGAMADQFSLLVGQQGKVDWSDLAQVKKILSLHQSRARTGRTLTRVKSAETARRIAARYWTFHTEKIANPLYQGDPSKEVESDSNRQSGARSNIGPPPSPE